MYMLFLVMSQYKYGTFTIIIIIIRYIALYSSHTGETDFVITANLVEQSAK